MQAVGPTMPNTEMDNDHLGDLGDVDFVGALSASDTTHGVGR